MIICSALVRNVLHERFRSPIRVLAVGLIILYLVYSDAFVLASGEITHLDTSWVSGDTRSLSFFAYVLGFGVIGQDMSSGTIQIILSRPLSRVAYVLSKWMAIFLGSAFLSIFTALAEHFISVGQNSSLLFDLSLLQVCASRILIALLSTSVIVCASSLFPGMRDIVALIAGSFINEIIEMTLYFSYGLSEMPGIPEQIAKIIDSVTHFLSYLAGMLVSITDLRLAFFVYGISWARITLFCLLISGLVSIAIFAVVKKEISYATD